MAKGQSVGIYMTSVYDDHEKRSRYLELCTQTASTNLRSIRTLFRANKF